MLKTLSIQTYTCANGLPLIFVPINKTPTASLQLWYNVGSKNETTGTHGIAHFIEHMIFKGTNTLSEADICMTTHKLSGSCNAFTSYDYTGYLFDIPSQNYKPFLSIMADCMQHCIFDQEHLASELKAIIQELKMYTDDFDSVMTESLMNSIFADHPYRNPIIGYKNELFAMNQDTLLNFYHQHYHPGNATLVIVGNLNFEELTQQVETIFGSIKTPKTTVRESFHHVKELGNTTITVYRDVCEPSYVFTFETPGLIKRKEYFTDCLTKILGSGRGSRLYQKLVQQRQLASDVDCASYDLFDNNMVIITVQPSQNVSLAAIKEIIEQELNDLSANGPTDEELERAQQKLTVETTELFEDTQKLAYFIGRSYTATKDPLYIHTYQTNFTPAIKKEFCAFLQEYCYPQQLSSAQVLPFSDRDTTIWARMQQKSDDYVTKHLSTKIRKKEIGQGSYVHTIQPEPQPIFSYPKTEKTVLSNGLVILSCVQHDIAKIEIVLDLKAKHFYDPINKQGLLTILYEMIREGTTNYTATALELELEKYGMSLTMLPGFISLSLLSKDLSHGLTILSELLTQALLTQESLDNIKARILLDQSEFWDTPTKFINQHIKNIVYKDHPYHKNYLGSSETLNSITLDDIHTAYKTYITPQGCRCAIVGDFDKNKALNLLQETFNSWTGPVITIEFPILNPIKHAQYDYPFNRDQVVLAYAGLSVKRTDKNFDPLLIYDQVFGEGILSSMNSRLFKVREQSGLFYTISGSLVARADEQPGMVLIKTLVSPDRLAEAQEVLEKVINEKPTMSKQELFEAQNALINSLVQHFTSYKQMAMAFIYLDTFGFPTTFFEDRPQIIRSWDIETICHESEKLLTTKLLATVRVGRI
jgi:zinc protease